MYQPPFSYKMKGKAILPHVWSLKSKGRWIFHDVQHIMLFLLTADCVLCAACYQQILLSTCVCLRGCVWNWSMSRARDTLMTWSPAVCFTISTALIRWEPLHGTARLINEEQPCAAADTCAHSFMHITPGSNRLCGKTPSCVHAHKNTHSRARPWHPPHCALSFCKFPLHGTTIYHTLIHGGTYAFLEKSLFEYKVCLARCRCDFHLLALTSEDYQIIKGAYEHESVLICVCM